LCIAALTVAFLLTPSLLFAADAHSEDITHMMTRLVFQIGIIIFAAKAFGLLFEKMSLPSVLGELVAGIVIGPYLLGSLALPGFHEGVFPLSVVTALPVSPELYGFATIASIVLLFSAGLETDFALFLRFSLAGAVLGIGGVIVSFAVGNYTAQYFISGNAGFMDPRCMFMGVLGTATSVGITARILSERRRMDSPRVFPSWPARSLTIFWVSSSWRLCLVSPSRQKKAVLLLTGRR
jgi:Kef-type K+ transport system membrane component KefB